MPQSTWIDRGLLFACAALVVPPLPALAAETPWPAFGHDHSNRNFSELTQIDRASVGRLRPAWMFQTGVTGYFQAQPLMVDGTLYTSTTQNNVAALDARTGRPLWTYVHKARTEKIFGPPSNRGLAVSDGVVFEATMDGRLIALDARTGRMVWDKEAVRPEDGESETASDLAGKLGGKAVQGSSRLGFKMPPLVAEGLVIVGVTGAGYGLHVEDEAGGLDGGAVVGIEGGYGRRGWLAAYDAKTGEERWRWYVTPSEGWEGGFVATTADGVPLHRDIAAEKAAAPANREAWRVGGGSLWMTPAYDPDLGLIFLGTGNPAPQNFGLSRPGDNLYTMCLVALDVRTGQLRWYSQQVPHDEWGYDVAAPPFLLDGPNGTKAVASASKTGWIYVHDRATGKLLERSAPLLDQKNLFAPPTAQGTVVAPGPLGAVSWPPTAYDGRLAYVQVRHGATTYTVKTVPAAGDRPEIRYTETGDAKGEPSFSTLTAVDLTDGGKIAWSVRAGSRLSGGTLATAGGLVFSGEEDGHLDAHDSRDGTLLWRFQCGAGISGPAMTYALDGKQYLAVAAGGASYTKAAGFGTGDALLVFALPD
ncbi:pyrroloquinoline quinone-dependent dehydrogenase [Methylobacterium sp. J-077]|uniref:pyrroloquinoline quinone-dependent dehydrogenase n=1 Tax=Methylobacterium sp. J-077 TaxID=2836656 RepID=UPI001FBB363D|nr:PQQ-binding-like beta-propeller repeat protein [Methylobacterium sp. J-077]MCJ2122784.1 PQQ-binding-like beta-propeller repeat protein [Methylobacterium sp. J-077]